MQGAVNSIRSLLAQTNRFSDMGRGFRGRRAQFDAGDLLVGLLVLGAVAAVLWLLWYLNSRHEGLRRRNGPLRLFHQLCGAHRLRWSERWLLWRLARAGRLRDPARLFLEPQRFDPKQLPGSLRGRANLFGRIRDRLFPELPDAPVEVDSDRNAFGSEAT